MTNPPPWAAAVADIIDPAAWSVCDSDDWNLARVRGSGHLVELHTGAGDYPWVALASVVVGETEHTADMHTAQDALSAAIAIRRCYAAALLASGDTEGALRVLGGGSECP